MVNVGGLTLRSGVDPGELGTDRVNSPWRDFASLVSGFHQDPSLGYLPQGPNKGLVRREDVETRSLPFVSKLPEILRKPRKRVSELFTTDRVKIGVISEIQRTGVRTTREDFYGKERKVPVRRLKGSERQNKEKIGI